MAITKKMLLAFVLTVLLATSSVRCDDNTPGFGIKQRYLCYQPAPCYAGGDNACTQFCVKEISNLVIGKCMRGSCCCIIKM
ncbi:hypothetical protein CARUB_v10016417mg [Capsella rubella]|uniref:Knottin scorpion toxin-like domain-containing protein n=1 Tax=Capsella rubella TaxID=81985 RepID=R0I4Z5_9BRAS|nr:hypothetical protein CARUB_v10016417mg [Capsella rubella]